MPPSHAAFFWKTCNTTRGRRPSFRSVSRAWLKYASVYQPARIFSTGRSKSSGGSRVLSVCAMLELEARVQRRLGDLQLLLRRLRRREPVLQLVAGLRERLRDEMIGIPRHPAEDRRRRDERADEMTSAPLVLLGRALTVLVPADGDVLRTVVRGELRTTHREHRRSE